MTTVEIPSTIDEAVSELGGLGELLTATEWHRAAIVAAFVRLDNQPIRGDLRSRSEVTEMTPHEFAALGIAGLRSKNTVQRYVQAWINAHDGKYPKPGAVRVLPTVEFPKDTGNEGSRATPQNIAKELANPEVREKVGKLLDTHHAIDLAMQASETPTREIPTPLDDMVRDPFIVIRHRILDFGKSAERLAADLSVMLLDEEARDDCSKAIDTLRTQIATITEVLNTIYGDPIDEISKYLEINS